MHSKLLVTLAFLPTAVLGSNATGQTNLTLNPSFERAEAKALVADDWKNREGIKVEHIKTDGRKDR